MIKQLISIPKQQKSIYKLTISPAYNVQIIHSDRKWSEQDDDPIVFDYKDLLDPFEQNEKAFRMTFGPYSAGTCLVQNIPGYMQARIQLLKYGSQLAYLPRDILNKLVMDTEDYTGWRFPNTDQQSQNSIQANNEGTFVAKIDSNNIEDLKPTDRLYILKNKNIWPSQIPEFKLAFQELVNIMMDVSKLLAVHIDKYIEGITYTYPKQCLQNIIGDGSHYGSLYHYYNKDDFEYIQNSTENPHASWGKWHNDFGAITALCPALYLDQKQKFLKFYDRNGGLHYRNRYGHTNKIHAPKDSIIFLVGEAMQILSGGVLEAVPHCVRKSSMIRELKLSRTSFSLNIQPKSDYQLSVPEKVHPDMVSNMQTEIIPPLSKRWENGISYQQFVDKSLEKYNKQQNNQDNI